MSFFLFDMPGFELVGGRGAAERPREGGYVEPWVPRAQESLTCETLRAVNIPVGRAELDKAPLNERFVLLGQRFFPVPTDSLRKNILEEETKKIL